MRFEKAALKFDSGRLSQHRRTFCRSIAAALHPPCFYPTAFVAAKYSEHPISRADVD